VRPQIVGALLDAVSRAVRDIDTTKLDQPGSMADFEQWSMAAASALGWTAKEFQVAYRNNENTVAEDTFEADAFAIAVHKFITEQRPDGWQGTPAELLVDLDNATDERIRKSRSWPKTPAQLGNRLKRAKPMLEHKGFAVDRRHSGTRTITIVPPRPAPRQDAPVRPSEP
jgi:putative DNA primase/helicase